MRAVRLNAYEAAPEAMAALRQVEAYLHHSLEENLIELVKMRASQIDGCAYGLAMHSKKLCANGECEERIYLLDAWQESSLYTARERAALAWTEALPHVAETHAPDVVYEELNRYFKGEEPADLTLLIGMTNLSSRLALGLRYQHPVD